MIAWIRGRIVEKRPPHLLVDVGGIGYELEAPMTTFYDLPETGAAVELWTHQVVREDAHLLFAFAHRRDRDLFRMLLRVSGVGAKVALAILSGMDATAFQRTVFEGDAAALARLPGIGKKTAERLIIEMRDRLARGAAPGEPAGAPASGPTALDAPADPVSEAVSALIALGLKPPDASKRVHAVAEKGLACEEIVRRALQSLVK